MLCLDMKLITRFRSDKKSHQVSNTLSPSGGPPGLEAPIPRRDRSKSLCVDKIGPLIQVENKVAEDTAKPANIFSRRRSTTTAL